MPLWLNLFSSNYFRTGDTLTSLCASVTWHCKLSPLLQPTSVSTLLSLHLCSRLQTACPGIFCLAYLLCKVNTFKTKHSIITPRIVSVTKSPLEGFRGFFLAKREDRSATKTEKGDEDFWPDPGFQSFHHSGFSSNDHSFHYPIISRLLFTAQTTSKCNKYSPTGR